MRSPRSLVPRGLGSSMVAVALGACGSAHGGAMSPDGGGPPQPALVFVVTGESFAFCHCHHGCGPGLDGTIDLSATNTTDAAVAFVVTGVTLEPTTGGVAIASSPAGYVTVALVGGGAFDGTVPARSTVRLVVSVYIDLADPLPLGSYRIGTEFTEDGTSMQFPSGPIDVPLGPGC